MESLTKRKISEQEIQHVVRIAFGQDQKVEHVEELTEGWYNALYFIRLSSGLETILKIAPSSQVAVMTYEQHIMRAEVGVTRRIQEQTQVPMPKIYYAAVDATADIAYFFMSLLPGKPLHLVRGELSERSIHEIERQVGVYSRQINGIQGTRFGYYNDPSYKSWSVAFIGMMNDLYNDAEATGSHLPFSREALLELLTKHVDVLDQVAEPSLVYWDLWDGNILVQGDQVTGFIDAERALWGDPLLEYYFHANANATDAYYEGYGQRFTSADAQVRRRLYDLHMAMIQVIECKYRGFSEEHAARMQAYLAEQWQGITNS